MLKFGRHTLKDVGGIKDIELQVKFGVRPWNTIEMFLARI